MSFAEELVNKINQFRTNPKGYAKKINEYVSWFKGKTLRIPGTNTGIRTEEGAAAYIEAVDFLSQQDGVEPLEPSKGLARICEDFMAEAQKVDPNELGNIDLEEIIGKYGQFTGDLNRAMDFGGEDPENVLINLIVCDGDPNRGNRESLLSTQLKKIGVANAKHPTYRYCTLIISCTEFTNTYDPNDEGFLEEGEKESSEPKEEETPQEKVVQKTPTIKETDEGKTIKPRKVILKETPLAAPPREEKPREIPQEKPREKPREIPREKPREKPREEKPPENVDDEEDEEVPPEDVIAEKRTEKIIMEKGKKKRVIKICRTMKDGSKETETIKEPVEDDEE